MLNVHTSAIQGNKNSLNVFLDSTNQEFQQPPETITISFATLDDFRKRFQAEKLEFGYGSDAIVENIHPICDNSKRTVNLVYIDVYSFCFKDQVGKIEIFNRASGRGWKFVTAEIALHLRLEYLNQSSGHVIYAPIESPDASAGKYAIAVIENDLGLKLFQGNSNDPNAILFGSNILAFELCD